MKRFINKNVLVLSICFLMAACADKTQEPAEQISESTAEIVTVKEPVLPEQAEALPAAQPAPIENEPLEAEPCTEGGQSESAPCILSSKPEPKKTPEKPKAKTLSDDQVIARFKQWDENLTTLETSFNQLSAYDGVEVSRSQGNLYYEKQTPMLRLDTLTLDGTISQTALTDKKTILILDDQNQPITTLSWQEWQQGQPNQALFDFGNYTALLGRHNVSVQEKTPVNTVLLLTPKEGENYQLYLTLGNHDYFPTEIKIVADLMVTTATLNDTRTNTNLDLPTLFGGFTAYDDARQ